VKTGLNERFQILTAASMKFRVFWDVVPCSQVDVDRRFRDAYCPDDGDSTQQFSQKLIDVSEVFYLHYYRPDNEGSKHLRNVSPEDSHLLMFSPQTKH
jgi:hypothetical protein